MEKFESASSADKPKPESKKENIQEVDEVKFEDLEKGDKLVVDTSMEPENSPEQYEVTVEKIVKTQEGKIRHLLVELKDPKEEEILEAKMSGGFSKVPEEWHYQFLDQGKKGAKPIPKEIQDKIGPTLGIIRKGDNEVLAFEDVNYKNVFDKTKSGKRKAFYCRSMTTNPIRKILLTKKAEKE